MTVANGFVTDVLMVFRIGAVWCRRANGDCVFLRDHEDEVEEADEKKEYVGWATV